LRVWKYLQQLHQSYLHSFGLQCKRLSFDEDAAVVRMEHVHYQYATDCLVMCIYM